MKKVTE